MISRRAALRRSLALAALLAGASVCAGTSPAASAPARAQTADDYESLPAPKAMAVSADTPDVFAMASGQLHDLAASMAALGGCEAKRPPEAARCEIVRLNDERIASGAELLARLPKEPHPLYLWRYEGPAATVFLAGSIHLLKPSLYPLPEQYHRAWEQSDHLVLEVNTDAYTPQQIQAKTLEVARLPEGQTLRDVLGEALYDRLIASLGRYGLDGAAIERLKPAMLMNQLVVARLLALGYLPEWGVEQQYLLDVEQRDVLELETLDSQLKLLFDQPLPVQVQLLADTLDQEMEITPMLEGMLVAWLSGNDAELEELFELQSGTSELTHSFNEDLLDRRNQQMASAIRSLLEDGRGTYFVLVGAAHHLGEAGIPALLDAEGVSGRRINTDTPPGMIESTTEDKRR